MIKNLCRIFMIVNVLLVLALSASALSQTGSIKGKITDSEGLPLPGAFVFIDSPVLLDIKDYITSDTGKFKFHGIPPGKYKLTAEMPGFKTANIIDITVSAGMTVKVFLSLETTTIQEETILKMPGPMLNPESSSSKAMIEEDLLKRIPFRRTLHSVLSSAPGSILDTSTPIEAAVIHGSNTRSNTFSLDSANMSDTVSMDLLTNINFDIMEEVTVETAGFATPIGQTEGGYIQVITKSGGNRTDGDFLVYRTSEGLTSRLTSKDEMSTMDASAPPLDRSLWDFSLSLGGAILPDKLWFFINGRILSQTRSTSFIPWTDPDGKEHKEYDQENREKMVFLKLTSQFLPNMKLSGLFNFADRFQSSYGSIHGWNLTKDAAPLLDHEKNITASGFVNYILDQNTFADFKASYVYHKRPMLINENFNNLPHYFDESTGRQWGSPEFNEILVRKRFHAGGYLTRFQDDFLAADHELIAGFEYENANGESSAWKEENLSVYYLNEIPYYGMSESPETGIPVGKGKVAFFIASREEDLFKPRHEMARIGILLEDTMTFADRITLKLGLRFDHSTASQLFLSKGESGNSISLALGEEFIKPAINVNPYEELFFPDWKNMIVWNTISPRTSLIFDVVGNGRSLVKASYARYPENLALQYVSGINPYAPYRSHLFYWYDENMDGIVDPADTFSPTAEDYRLYSVDYYTKRIAPDVSAPYTNEITAGFHQEVLSDLSVSLNYIFREKKNILENALYSPDINMDWYAYNRDTADWWIPFQTVVPGIDEYPDTPVTLYFRSNDAPLLFYRLKNIPELIRKYRALEFSVKKSMSHNWQLSGSVVLSKATGNTGLGYGLSSGITRAANDPNYFTNFSEDSRLDLDKPLIIKLMGTYRFPWDFFLSFFFTHYRGAPWARSVTVVPPSSWTETANAQSSFVSVLLEKPEERRYVSQTNLDIRVEKEFSLGSTGKIRFLLDVLNALGSTYENLILNDGGYWYPEGEGSAAGNRVLDPTYKKASSLLGTRVFIIGLNFQF